MLINKQLKKSIFFKSDENNQNINKNIDIISSENNNIDNNDHQKKHTENQIVIKKAEYYKPILAVLNRHKPRRIPIWFMRQAGRYLPEYRELRKGFKSFIDMCLNKDASVTAALQPLERFDLDGGIVFSDIMILLYALGIKVDFIEGEGPIVGQLGKDYQVNDFKKYKLNDEVIEKVVIAIKLLSAVIKFTHPNVTLIGFAGAPWTLFCYMLEGKKSSNFFNALRFLYENYEDSISILNILSDHIVNYLSYQIEAGVEVVKIFDTWAGIVPFRLSRAVIFNPIKNIVSKLKTLHPNIPIIVFPKGISNQYTKFSMYEVSAVAVDGTADVEIKNIAFYDRCAIQGNIDNILLTAKHDNETMIKIIAHAYHLLKNVPTDRLIVNTSHGLLPQTSIANVEFLISIVRSYR